MMMQGEVSQNALENPNGGYMRGKGCTTSLCFNMGWENPQLN